MVVGKATMIHLLKGETLEVDASTSSDIQVRCVYRRNRVYHSETIELSSNKRVIVEGPSSIEQLIVFNNNASSQPIAITIEAEGVGCGLFSGNLSSKGKFTTPGNLLS